MSESQVEEQNAAGEGQEEKDGGAENKGEGGEQVILPIVTSKRRATVGRTVLLFCPELWSGSQPAVVVRERPDEPVREGAEVVELAGQHVRVNVFADGIHNPQAVSKFRGRNEGNTFDGVPLYEPQSDEGQSLLCKRQTIAADSTGTSYVAWAEWPARV